MSLAGSSKQKLDEEENLVWFTASNAMKDPKKEETGSTPDLSMEKVRRERPKYYKVQETPALNAAGIRECSYCHGQVRPQVCGGRKPRWRCGNKTCRKWYGWVREGDEVPMFVNRKGRPNGIFEGYGLQRLPIIKKRSRSSTEESLPPTLTPVSPIRFGSASREDEDEEMGDEEEFQLIPDEADDLTRGLECDVVKREDIDAEYYESLHDQSLPNVHVKDEF